MPGTDGDHAVENITFKLAKGTGSGNFAFDEGDSSFAPNYVPFNFGYNDIQTYGTYYFDEIFSGQNETTSSTFVDLYYVPSLLYSNPNPTCYFRRYIYQPFDSLGNILAIPNITNLTHWYNITKVVQNSAGCVGNVISDHKRYKIPNQPFPGLKVLSC